MASSKSGWQVNSADMTTEDLATIIEAPESPDPGKDGWCFVESPTRAGFVTDRSSFGEILENAWLVRSFAKEIEIYARRLSYTPDVWRVRLLSLAGAKLPGKQLWEGNEVAAVTQGVECRVLLLSPGDGRFRRADIMYPKCENGTGRAVLVCEEFRLEDDPAPLMRWASLGESKAAEQENDGQC